MKNIVFLSKGIMPYQSIIFKELTKYEYMVYIIIERKPVNRLESSYYESHKGITIYELKDFSKKKDLIKKITDLTPQLVLCSGWKNKYYCQVCNILKNKYNIKTVVRSDTQWKGGRQWFNRILSEFRHKKWFSYFLAAGLYQYDYARKLGFSNSQILTPCLTADTNTFLNISIDKKRVTYPKNFLFVGRFVPIKGIEILTSAWNLIEDKKGWTLTCVGEGYLKKNIEKNNNIIVKDFMSQNDLAKEAENSGCFILPSIEEPWAVVLHEFSAAGLPIIASDVCGATPYFVISGYNGYSFPSKDIKSLALYMNKIINMSNNDLIEMSINSRSLSYKINPDIAVRTLLSLEYK